MSHTLLPLKHSSPFEVTELIQSQFEPVTTSITVPVDEAAGHILAESVQANRNVPAFDNSAMDGVIIRKADYETGQTNFQVVDEIPPERLEVPELPAGKAMRIMTGAPLPENGDLIIPVELLTDSGEEVIIREIPSRNPIRRKGEGYREGVNILSSGTCIRPYESGLMIEAGLSECPVLKPVRVGVQVTGSEISRSRNTNGPVITRLLNKMHGVETVEYPVVEDQPDTLRRRLYQLKEECDVLVTTGGISAGKYDYIPEILESSGARLLVRKINQKPGKPFTLYEWEGKPVCCLPGNPVSAVFTAEWYAGRVLARLTDQSTRDITGYVRAGSSPLVNNSSRHLFVPGRFEFNAGRVTIHAEANMKSHLMQLFRESNCYVHLSPQQEYQDGDVISALRFIES